MACQAPANISSFQPIGNNSEEDHPSTLYGYILEVAHGTSAYIPLAQT
jgi:hypothetical protein